MKIHEYQAKELLRAHGVPVPRGYPAFSVREADEAAQKLGGAVWVVKAQIHAGGRGKGGGVKVVKSVEDVEKEPPLFFLLGGESFLVGNPAGFRQYGDHRAVSGKREVYVHGFGPAVFADNLKHPFSLHLTGLIPDPYGQGLPA